LPEFDQRHAFFQAGRREFKTFRIVGEYFVVFGYRLRILPLGVGDFSEIKLGVGSQIGVTVKF